MEVLQTSAHLAIFLGYFYGLYYDVKPPKGNAFEAAFWALGGRFKYLTFLDALLQCGFFGLSVLNDFLGSEVAAVSKMTFLQKFRDWIFTTLVFPLGVFVPFIFWTLYAVDRELIFPASLDSWFPSWLNHVMHTLPIVGVLVEMYAVNHIFQKGSKRYIPILVVYALYLSWICYIAYAAGFWVYPVFEVLDFKGRTIFLAALLLPNLCIVFLAPKLHNMLWGTTKQSKKKGKKE